MNVVVFFLQVRSSWTVFGQVSTSSKLLRALAYLHTNVMESCVM